jgi:hypothetical protein
MDVKTAFLNRYLYEDLYMTYLKVFSLPKMLKKYASYNGLFVDQSKFPKTKVPQEFGFVRNEDDPCVYNKVSECAIIFLNLCVNDILLMGDNIPILQSVRSWLHIAKPRIYYGLRSIEIDQKD